MTGSDLRAHDASGDASLAGRVVGVTADRRWEEQAALLEKRGARVVHGPTMATVDLTQDPALRAVTEAIVRDPPDLFVVTTGAGFKLWLETAAEWGLRDQLVGALGHTGARVIARGAKGASAARGAGLEVAWRADHESMEEVVQHVSATSSAGERVALQLFDPDEHWATLRLREIAEAHGAPLVEVPVYRWRLPTDVRSAEDLVRAVVNRSVDAVTFTSQPAVRFLFAIAERLGCRDDVAGAFAADVFAICVGPVCAEALREAGVDRTAWPEPPRLVPMVKMLEQVLGPAGSPPGGLG